jgi:starch synthase (maltosyl-transferring)
LAGTAANWPQHLERARKLGFSHVCVAPIFAPASDGDAFLIGDHERPDPALGIHGSADDAAGQLAAQCRRAGLKLMLDLVLDRVAADGATAMHLASAYVRGDRDVLDPRTDLGSGQAARLRVDRHDACEEFCRWWTERMVRLAAGGATAFRLIGADSVPAPALKRILDDVRAKVRCDFFVWTPGTDRRRLAGLSQPAPEGVFASTAWWDGRASWYLEEHEALRLHGQIIGVVAPPVGERAYQIVSPESRLAHHRRTLRIAAATSDGLFVPMGFEFLARSAEDPFDASTEAVLGEDIRAANDFVDRLGGNGTWGEMRSLTSPANPVTLLARLDSPDARSSNKAMLIAINTDADHSRDYPKLAVASEAGIALTPDGDGGPAAQLEPNEVRVSFQSAAAPIHQRQRPGKGALRQAIAAPRIVIDRLTPSVDGGTFPARRIVGRSVTVEANVFMDGHEVLRADLLWKAADETEWRRTPLTSIGNDRWRGSFVPDRVGRWTYTVEGWLDEYATLCHGIEAKHKAGADFTSDLAEAQAMLDRLSAKATTQTCGALERAAGEVRSREPHAAVAVLTAPATTKAVAMTEERAFVAMHEPLWLEVERPQAEFASWYELFPRSLTDDPSRHGTLRDVIGALPRIRAMGFDVLYFPPIHPIGTTNRKGRNNTLKPGPDDHGSPYAIGSREGGHTALHPALGTIEDFRALRTAAHEHGLELALDFAIQCSLDHPWLKEHPGWFRWRPDGSIKFAENPPKKYEDIVNVDFYAPDAVPELWEALRDVVLYWADEGVRIFRVDNPHTKPLPFWRWMIDDIRRRHPDVIFLSEAFTRPTMMYRLAKVGFSQSYTYFTWRNTKRELTEYLKELTTSEVREFFRPHFFVNTPDINPIFLQTSGRPGFLIRAALATTLSGLWGMYSGFELCEGAPLPGREEYLDSEKYEIRIRDFDAPGNIVAEISALNRIRKANPALHSHLGLTFYNCDHDQVLVYGKALTSHEDVILTAINLDPHHAHEAGFEIPLWEWHLPDSGSLDVEDLMSGRRFVWTGKHQRWRLDPAVMPFAIWRLSPVGGRPT